MRKDSGVGSREAKWEIEVGEDSQQVETHATCLNPYFHIQSVCTVCPSEGRGGEVLGGGECAFARAMLSVTSSEFRLRVSVPLALSRPSLSRVGQEAAGDSLLTVSSNQPRMFRKDTKDSFQWRVMSCLL